MSLSFRRILTWIVAWIVPFALILTAVRTVINPWFVDFEYRTPGFPPDPFGFTQAERLTYSKIAIDYLLNNAGIDFLGNLHFPDGQTAPAFSCQFMTDCTRLYNERELQHMVDVKRVVQGAIKVWYASLALLLVGGVWAWFGGWRKDYFRGLRLGGWITIVFIAFILLFVVAAFGVFFVFFHDVFFAPGTWTFYYSDTLIRLFPERFWRDTFLVVGTIAAGLALLAVWLGGLMERRNLPAPEHS